MKSERVLIACPMCTQRIRAPRRLVGQPVHCPTCHHRFVAELAGVIDERLLSSVESGPLVSEVVVREVPTTGASNAPERAETVALIEGDPLPPPLPSLGIYLTPGILLLTHWLGLALLLVGAGLMTVPCVILILARVLSPFVGVGFLLFAWAVIFTLALAWRIGFETISLVWQRATFDRLEKASQDSGSAR